jgi:hypothetical protein
MAEEFARMAAKTSSRPIIWPGNTSFPIRPFSLNQTSPCLSLVLVTAVWTAAIASQGA